MKASIHLGGFHAMTMIFWAATGSITLVVAVVLLRALRRTADEDLQSVAFDQRVYRDQLAEIERDQARGVIAGDEAKRLRSEVARRLLATDRVEGGADVLRAGPKSGPNSGPSSVLVLGAVAMMLAAGFGGYVYLGQPGYGDLPLQSRIAMAEARRAERPNQAALEAALPARPQLEAVDPEFLVLLDKLRTAVASRPDDLQGQQLLARNEANVGNLTAAYQAQGRVVALKGAEATDGDVLTQATLMVQAADGEVSPEAEALLQQVLARDPANDTALFFTGIVNMQVGRYDMAFGYWNRLLQEAPGDSPWRAEVLSRMVALADVAGVKYEAPAAAPGLPGPDADAIAAAQDMTPEERQAMIRSMVEGLSERLASEGGRAEEWARLIMALGNLGELDRAAAIYAEAQKTFAGRTVELSGLRQAAVEAGLPVGGAP